MNKLVLYAGILGIFYGRTGIMSNLKEFNTTVSLSIGDNVINTTLTKEPRVIEVFNSDNELITDGLGIDYQLTGGLYDILISTSEALTDVKLNVIAW